MYVETLGCTVKMLTTCIKQQSHDRLKRKALLAPNPQAVGNDAPPGFGGHASDSRAKHRTFGMNIENNLGMEANGVGNTYRLLLMSC